MDKIGSMLGTPLGYLLKLCYDLTNQYGLAIIIFTLFTKVVLFPVSLMVQKNSIKMIKMKPQLDALKYQYVDDNDALIDAQSALYKQEKYSPFAGMIPLLIQIPLIFGLLDVVYRPLKHILHLPQGVINVLSAKTVEITGMAELGSSPELVILKSVCDPANYAAYMACNVDFPGGIREVLASIQSVDMRILGIDLTAVPGLRWEWLLLIPIFAGLSALLMCIVQNKINVLQMEQSWVSQWGMTLFMVAFSTYFAFLVPASVGLYWIFGNLFSIPVMYVLNWIYDPKDYIDYASLETLKVMAKEEQAAKRVNAKLSRQGYHDICKGTTMQDMKILFYSEQSGFYKYFENIINAFLAKSDEIIYYVTSDPQDQVFQKKSDRFRPYYISGNQLIAFMMKLECQIVVMTMPDLEKYHIKRSRVRKDIEYIFTDHGIGSCNMLYRTGALDYFDTVLLTSKYQGMEIRQLEKLRNTKRKHLVTCGYGLIDNMIEAYQGMEKTPNEKPTILIAPSWQQDNILDSCLDNIISGLVGDSYRVIVRPHPQYIRRFPMKIQGMKERYQNQFGPDFAIETDFSSNVTVYTADLVITDWSGIAYEFSFTTGKPALFIDTDMKVVNKDWQQIKIKPFDITARNSLGKSISKAETKNIAAVVDDLLRNQEAYQAKILEIRDNFFYNLGCSGEAAADYLIQRLQNPHSSTATSQDGETEESDHM